MEKRPTSIIVIACLLVLGALFSFYSAATLPSNVASNPVVAKMMAGSPVSIQIQQIWTAIGAVVGLICAYGIWKGMPWSRVLYLVWGIIGLVVGFYVSPIKVALVFALLVLIIVCFFLWTNTANDWFQARGLMLKREGGRGGGPTLH